ncbi:glutathione S-transferase N-terminal domain-containing protein [Paenalcaligenes niemegkensis]|uniref:glutathione S-transferase family protein n=1 Tax=Paenalcaligenes niemegkensis TaxID=2895469 RepID=UPI001EE7AB63|nr:glutathione S-transferase N-terminal domain-containing protein [Paenalcaligenes niemegkensis]MCQ9616327.1 glutathione S-transferase N-terminal domain-containing protein [Paenalcaligenes niemegkensis]
MKLYYLPGACPLASHIVLAWTGKSYSLQSVSRTELKESAFLALNPLGAVPVLVDGDLVLTQSSAILEYLAEIAPEAALIGDTPAERAETRRWLALINADIHRNFGMIFGVQGYAQSESAQAELKSNAAKKLRSFFKIVDQQLEAKDWLTGTRSIADPYLYTVLRWANALKIDLSGFDNLRRFSATIEKDAGVQKALGEQGLS